jgi:hypothetical protein
MFHKITPILPASNTELTKLFYEDKLNFESSYFDNYLVVSKWNIEIYFFEHRDKASFRNSSCFIWVSNIEDLYAKFSSLELIHPAGRLEEKNSRMKTFSILDNNGHILKFGESTR